MMRGMLVSRLDGQELRAREGRRGQSFQFCLSIAWSARAPGFHEPTFAMEILVNTTRVLVQNSASTT